MAKKITYSEAFAELETILESLETNEEFNPDLVTKQVNRAAQLLEICKKQLGEIDEDLEKLLEKLD